MLERSVYVEILRNTLVSIHFNTPYSVLSTDKKDFIDSLVDYCLLGAESE